MFLKLRCSESNGVKTFFFEYTCRSCDQARSFGAQQEAAERSGNLRAAGPFQPATASSFIFVGRLLIEKCTDLPAAHEVQ